ncbi:MAG: histidine phosphatase family protein [Haliscomenobacter sp.]|nr:histidine phosphatase family protein [Haliscomenobacter sp.]MBK8653513.1 histidine phosphatase family protein [Haliscomenobacter sp.]MBP9077595.1 histidine phosphatase family protein [Haliscomenobacter sp.]MBP9873806.1 histidine phosphatase family protein [Haliscomenobacter sp.]
MKTVYFVRHAKSSWSNESLRDIDRPLNKRGLRDAPLMARILREKGVKPDLFLSSPAKRALTTAEIFAAGLDVDAIRVEPQLYEAFPEDVLRVVQGVEDAVQTLFVFGHNPTFFVLANRFSKSELDNVPTCGIVCVEAHIDSWKDFREHTGRMTAFLYPKQFYS